MTNALRHWAVLIALSLITIDLHAAELKKAAELKQVAESEYRLFWKSITTARLAVNPEASAPRDILDPGYEKRLGIEYHIGVSKERFVKMAEDALQDNYSDGELEPHRDAVEQFYGMLDAVSDGDRYQLHWQPGNGLQLLRNGKSVGLIESEEGSRLILSIWLGRAAISEGQRDDVLKQWRSSLSQSS